LEPKVFNGSFGDHLAAPPVYSKKQQMRWSAAGAQLLLHVRTADLNGRLGHYVGRATANDATPIAIAA
jgi:hypothetical protein